MSFDQNFYTKDKLVKGFTSNEKINPILSEIYKIQQKLNVKGDVGEIGVHHGKSFIPLLYLLNDDEKGLAIDKNKL